MFTQNIKVFEYNNFRVKLQVWDTVGSERFRTISNNYFRGKDGIFIVFDLSERASFEQLGYWINLSQIHSEGSVKFLVGNKSDLNDLREVTDE